MCHVKRATNLADATSFVLLVLNVSLGRANCPQVHCRGFHLLRIEPDEKSRWSTIHTSQEGRTCSWLTAASSSSSTSFFGSCNLSTPYTCKSDQSFLTYELF